MNLDADCLSRLPLDIRKYVGLCIEKVDTDVFRALVAGARVQGSGVESWTMESADSLLERVMGSRCQSRSSASIFFACVMDPRR